MRSNDEVEVAPLSQIFPTLQTALMCGADMTFGEIIVEATGSQNPATLTNEKIVTGLRGFIAKTANRDLSATRIRTHEDAYELVRLLTVFCKERDLAVFGVGISDLAKQHGMFFFHSMSDPMMMAFLQDDIEQREALPMASA